MKIKMFFYAQRKSQFDPPETATNAKRASIRGTLWADGEDAYLKLDGRGVVVGELMTIDSSELPQIDAEEEQAGWHRVQVTTQDGEKAWAYQYRTNPPEDSIITNSWPISKIRSRLERVRIRHGKDPVTGETAPTHEAERRAEEMEREDARLRKSVAKPEQAPWMPENKTVAKIEDGKQDLDWKTKDLQKDYSNAGGAGLHMSQGPDCLHKATGKLGELIREHRRLVQVLRSKSRADDMMENAIQTKELAGYEKQGLGKNQDLERVRNAKKLSNVDVLNPNPSVPVHQKDEGEGPLVKAITPEGNKAVTEQASRVRKGNKDLTAKQPTPLKGKGVRPPQGRPGAPTKPLRKSQAIQVSTVAVIHGDHILMGRRRDTKKLVLPGGHADPGEHPEQTARRELYEEAGINAKELKYLGSEEVVGRDGKTRRINCFVTFGNFTPTNVHDPDQEIMEWLWVPAVQFAPAGCSDALHEDIAAQLHDRHNNILLKLLGIAH